MSKTAVIGTGSWGTALAILLHANGHEVTMWSAIPEEIVNMKNTHRHQALGEAVIADDIILTDNLESAMDGKDVLVLAVPSIYVRGTARNMRKYYKPGQIIVNVAKGIEEDTLMFLDEQIKDEIPDAEVAVLSGPSHAEEVAKNLPTVVVVASESEDVAKTLQQTFMSPVFRVYLARNVRIVELGAALKNVIALAAGIADGLGFGDNIKAALITRGIFEMTKLGTAMGNSPDSLYGLTGIGDLIVTCASMHSRNRRAGILIGQGKSMQEAMDEVHMVVEGVYSAKAAKALADKYNVEMPIVDAVNKVLFENKSAREAVVELMTRSGKRE